MRTRIGVAMICRVLTLVLVASVGASASASAGAGVDVEPESVSFVAADGVEVSAYWFESAGAGAAPVVLLFHQAGGDALGEYRWIAGRLVEAGYRVLAVDQRVGGDRFGGPNRTAEKLKGSDELSYCDAYPDLEAALAWAGDRAGGVPIAAWGSSYSAALIFRLAAEHGGDFAAGLAFSPAGSRMDACEVVDHAERVRLPILAVRPQGEMEYESVAAQAEALRAGGFEVYVAEGRTHGSSILHPERTGTDVEPSWERVLAFLAKHLER